MDAVLPKEGKWFRCFKALPGWQGHEFHTACDGKGPTVTIIRVKENIFGGFIDKSWGGECVRFLHTNVSTSNAELWDIEIYDNCTNKFLEKCI